MKSNGRSRGLVSRSLIVSLLVLNLGPLALRAAETSSPAKDGPAYVVEYYYKTKWGYSDEFIRLFKKNHYPLLAKQMEAGRILSITAVKPRLHATEDGRWDYRVTLAFKNVVAANDSAGEETLKRQLFPDQEAYQKEEQRRFEILLAHWDVPIVDVDLKQ